MTRTNEDMVLVEGGTFRMGSAAFYPDETPVHERTVGPLLLDRRPVTNADYREFVAETGYVTVAERPLDPAQFAGADPADLVPGDGVHAQDNDRYARWAHARLPTEAEHEYASRGGLAGAEFAWGHEPYPGGVPQANTWIGRFPYQNLGCAARRRGTIDNVQVTYLN